MSWEFMLTKGVNASLVILFFASIVLFLRFLYGPKGIMRDPLWDDWNEKARLALEKDVDAKTDMRYKKDFLQYARSHYCGDPEKDEPLELKVEHTLKVLAIAEELAESEAAFSEHAAARALRLSALFHDVGRFRQYRNYRTFSDVQSCNHALLGVRVIREQKFLASESKDMRHMVLSAVAAHNKLRIPQGVSGRVRDVLLGLRDADKLDILRVLANNLEPGKGNDTVLLHLEDVPGACSEPVLKALEEGRVALYTDMRYHNDFRILLCTWLHDLHFASSLRIARREGYYDRILAGLSPLPDIQRAAAKFVESRLASAGSGV